MNAYWAHMRPATMLPTFLSALTGYALAPTHGTLWLELPVLFVVHSVLLWGGTNAWNTACDGEAGALTLLPRPPPIPQHLGTFGAALKGLALVVAGCWNTAMLAVTLVAVLLSFFYSTHVPWWPRGKNIVGVDMLINATGSGLLSFAMGWAVVGAPMTAELGLVGGAFSLAYFAGMPTTQIFQLNRRSRDWASVIGPRRVLLLGGVLFIVHLGLVCALEIAATLWLWLLWVALTVASAAHLFWWARTPRLHAYPRMIRQLVLAMGAQAAWTAGVWS